MKSSRDRSPVLVDLFCGAGGLSLGLGLSGFRSALGLDFDSSAIATYATNNPGTAALCEDVGDLTAKRIFEIAGTKDIDVIAGGPSCQGFSTHGKRIEDDPRNFLFREFARLVRDVKPKFFLMENVKGLLAYRGGHFKKLIESSFARAGYSVTSAVLCAADFGVPQLRHRVFFIGTRTDVDLSMPLPTHGADPGLFSLAPYVTVGDAIGDLPLMHGDVRRELWPYASAPRTDFQRYARSGTREKLVTLHQANGLSEQARRIASFVKQGEGLRSVPVRHLPERFRKMRTISTGELRRDCTTLYHRLSPERPAYTITTYFRNVASGPFLHPYEDRSLSVREAARLMSFPDRYQFVGTGIPRQIGNAVPPLLAKALGEHLLQLLGISKRDREMIRERAIA